MKKYIIALDEGTSSARALLWDVTKNCVTGTQTQKINCYYPRHDWVEQDAEEIYNAQIKSLNDLIAKYNIRSNEVYALGITNQRESVILWDKNTGKPVYPVISWLDRRTGDYCGSLKGMNQTVYEITGLNISPYFSATKIKWIIDNVPGVRECAAAGDILCGTIDTYLIWRLSKGKSYVTDMSNASRTMLFNINTLTWDSELGGIFGLPKIRMPGLTESAGYIGEAELDGGSIPICADMGDQQSALFGQCCFQKGDVKVTYGTGAFILVNIGHAPVINGSKLLTTVAWSINGQASYAYEGNVYNAGKAVQWIRDNMGFIADSAGSERAAESVPDTGGVYFVPAFSGLGTPYWDSGATGTICGITAATQKEHIVRAALESMAYGIKDNIEILIKDLGKINSLRVDGGACVNSFLMQFQSDILGVDIVRPENLESTALGVIYAAGLGCGVYKDVSEIKVKTDRIFSPAMDSNVRNRLYSGWKEAIGKSRYTLK